MSRVVKRPEVERVLVELLPLEYSLLLLVVESAHQVTRSKFQQVDSHPLI